MVRCQVFFEPGHGYVSGREILSRKLTIQKSSGKNLKTVFSYENSQKLNP